MPGARRWPGRGFLAGLRQGIDSLSATWRNGYAAACKAVYPGSIPGVASRPSLAGKSRVNRRKAHEDVGKARILTYEPVPPAKPLNLINMPLYPLHERMVLVKFSLLRERAEGLDRR